MAKAHHIVLQPLITEKTTRMMEEENVYTLLVAEESNKTEIRQAVEELWDVKVTKVRTARLAGKYRRGLLGQMAGNWLVGRRNDFKKAMVTLELGDHIEFYELG